MIELLPDSVFHGRPKPIAFWFSIVAHIVALTFCAWEHERQFHYVAVYAAAPPTITWFDGKLTMPSVVKPETAEAPPEVPSTRPSAGGAYNWPRRDGGTEDPIAPPKGESPGEPVEYAAPVAWSTGLLDEDTLRSTFNVALAYRPAGGGFVGGLLSGVNGGAESGIAGAPPPPLLATAPASDAAPAAAPAIRIGGQLEPAVIVKQTFPSYPQAALHAGVEGVVVLEATIEEDGKLHNIHVMSGNPLLIAAAIECIKNWKYRPALLNGEVVSSPASIEVRFIIQRSNTR
jgi:TonB family protein